MPPRGPPPKRPLPAEPPIPPIGSPRFFEEVNQGPLEEAYEARLADRAAWGPLPWLLLPVGILIGLLFSYVNLYASLAVGITVGGSYYLTYFIGVMARWRPGVINYIAGASTGASQSVIGVAVVLPVLLILAAESASPFAGQYAQEDIPDIWALAGFFVAGGAFGVLFFQSYRRLWLVERPLPYPGGFDATAELLALSGRAGRGEARAARQSVFVLVIAALVAAFFVMLRDLRAFGPSGSRMSFLDDMLGSRFYRGGNVPDLAEFRPFYNGLVMVDPFFLAVGWFVRRRVAGILLLGSFVTFIVAFFDSAAYADPSGVAFGLLRSWAGNARTMAAGAIVGAGLFALVRQRRHVVAGVRALLGRGGAGADTTFFGRGVLPGAAGVLLVVSVVLLVAGGASIPAALLVVPLAVLLVLALGFVAVKVTGETSVQPVSPMAVLALLFLLGVLQLVGASPTSVLVLGLGAVAFVATGVVMSTDVFLDTKVALYVGNPPQRQALAQVLGLVPGVLIGVAGVWFFREDILGWPDPARSSFALPLQGALARLSVAFTSGDVSWAVFFLAAGIGIAVELATGLGTAFGIGMALQVFVPGTIFAGALLRDLFEARTPKSADPDALVSATRFALPSGVFVGASLASLAVFALHEWLL